MTVRCEQCGHENDTQYHFCGMCGSSLPRVAAPVRTSPATPAPNVPSFLSLGDEPKRNLNYLLEDDDDEPRSHTGLYVSIVLLLLLGGGAAWYWWNGALPWEGRLQKDSVSSQATPTPSATVTPPVEPGSPPQTAASSPETNSKPAVTPPPEPGTPTAPTTPPANDKPAAVPTPQATAPATDSDDEPAASGSSSPPSDTADQAVSAPPAAAKAPPAPKVQTPKARPVAAPLNPGDKLVSDGEKYLYGTGVTQDCDRAQKDLLSAAHQENSKAYTLLGAMYATGHCVTKDLPSSYRWFARALHQDPSNARLQQNLEVIWKQMTQQERHVATQAP